MMYYIIGGDRQEYGPIPGETLAQWIAEGRANRDTQARAEHDTAWRPLGAIPEFATALGGTGAAVCAECLRSFPEADMIRHGHVFVCAHCKPIFLQKLAEGATVNAPKTADTPTLEEVLARDYNVDIGRCFSSAWKVCTENLWPVVGVSAAVIIPSIILGQAVSVGLQFGAQALFDIPVNVPVRPGEPPDLALFAASMGVNFFASVVNGIISTFFFAGLYYYLLKLLRGEPATIEDAYSGFTRAPARLLGAGILRNFGMFIGLALCVLPGIFVSICWIFTELLVMDRRLGAWEALSVGLRVVMKHWFIVFALVLVTGLVAGAGVIACCVGLLFTMPLGFCACAQAYQDIFGTPPGPRN